MERTDIDSWAREAIDRLHAANAAAREAARKALRFWLDRIQAQTRRGHLK